MYWNKRENEKRGQKKKRCEGKVLRRRSRKRRVRWQAGGTQEGHRKWSFSEAEPPPALKPGTGGHDCVSWFRHSTAPLSPSRLLGRTPLPIQSLSTSSTDVSVHPRVVHFGVLFPPPKDSAVSIILHRHTQ